MVKEMSESQMTLIIDLLADVMAQESCRNDEDTKSSSDLRRWFRRLDRPRPGRLERHLKT
jgi:hypothetical protein